MKFLWFHKLFNTKAYQQYQDEIAQAELKRESLRHFLRQETLRNIQRRAEREAPKPVRTSLTNGHTSGFRRPKNEPSKRNDAGEAYRPTGRTHDPWEVTPAWSMPPRYEPDPTPEPVRGHGGSFDGGGASSDWSSSTTSDPSPSTPD